jgi:catechol 2,3-dioxygenase-like lactoylglutathione lyase family enzyme
MIGYINLGTNQFEQAAIFYDQLLAVIGAERVAAGDHFVAWAVEPGMPMLSIIKPYDGEAASVGNGVMVALKVASNDSVDAIYAQALALGGSDEGAPGMRGSFYAAYFRDLDGNKLNAFCL